MQKEKQLQEQMEIIMDIYIESLLRETHLSVFNGKNVINYQMFNKREATINYGTSTINVIQPLKCRILNGRGKCL